MKSTELRIGNFVDTLTGKEVLVPAGVPMKILSISIGGCDVLEIDKVPAQEKYWPKVSLYELSPIPLTPEWLERFGFTMINDDGLWQSPHDELFQIQDEYLNGGFGHIWDATFTEAAIEYIHQVQNLHFALTGTELDPTDQNLK